MIFDSHSVAENFPILSEKICGKPLVYLDNAATMQMPGPVLNRIRAFYHAENANIHRGIHSLSEGATEEYEKVRETVRRFIDAEDTSEIIFTSGTTASVNMTAQMLEPLLFPGDEILLTAMEHHSNLLPWMELAKRKSLVLGVVPVLSDGTLDLDEFKEMINPRTKVAAFTELSNVTGIRNPVEEMIRIVRAGEDRDNPTWILVDGAQGVVHGRKSIRMMRPDFYCFSGHKLGAPTGTGVLYIRKDRQHLLRPAWFGGGIVNSVSFNTVSYVEGPSLFEPGTPNYAGTIGLGAALEYWMREENNDESHEQVLLRELESSLSITEGIRVLGKGQEHQGCLSFIADQIPAYDLCRLLDHYGIAVRSGHMCAHPYLEALGCEHAVRVSVAPYNTIEEIRYFIQTLHEILTIAGYSREISDSSAMSMQELEQDILNDMAQLQDPMDQYSFLVACAGGCLPYPEYYRNEKYYIQECQVNTWVYTDMVDERCVFFADSESLIVKGVLALMQEIYFGRSAEEIENYSMQLLRSPMIQSHLNREQLNGLKEIAKRLGVTDRDTLPAN